MLTKEMKIDLLQRQAIDYFLDTYIEDVCYEKLSIVCLSGYYDEIRDDILPIIFRKLFILSREITHGQLSDRDLVLKVVEVRKVLKQSYIKYNYITDEYTQCIDFCDDILKDHDYSVKDKQERMNYILKM